MIDYKLNSSGSDILFEEGDFIFVSGHIATRQRLEQKLRLWKNEWFIDQDAGIPWLQEILGKRPRVEKLQAIFGNVIQSDPGIQKLDSLTFSSNNGERHVSVVFSATLTDGSQITDMEITI